jgi:hypothetical protein
MIEILLDSLRVIWESVIGFLPTFLAALIVFIAGWLIAIFVGKLANRLIKAAKLDSLLVKLGVERTLTKAKLKLDSGKFFEELVKWFFIIVFLMAATDILGLTQVTLFLNTIILYLPNVIVAAVVLLGAAIISNFMYKLVKASANAAGLASASVVGTVTRWAILIFGLIIALSQLGIAANLMQTLWIGIVAMLAIAGGLAFGLGGKDLAAKTLEKIKQDLNEK